MDAAVTRRPIWPAAALVLATCAAYFPVWSAGFVWNDDAVLLRNPLIRAADGLRQIWFTARGADYWPLTESSLWVEWRIWGTSAVGYHATNLALHILSVVLLWRLLEHLRFPGAFVAAGLFALHPLNVESVAWIAERKNLLAMVFFLLSIGAYVRSEEGGKRAYGASVAAFVLGMLSKGSVAVLPLVLAGLILCRRPLRREDALRLCPYFLIAAGLTLVNLWFQKESAGGQIRIAGMGERALGAAAAIWFYLEKSVWPVHLSFVYPMWKIDPSRWIWWVPAAAFVGASAVLALSGPRRLAWAWAYFCVALIPVLGFADVYFMKYSLVADHYAHLALIGVVAWVAAVWARWNASVRSIFPQAAAALAAVILGILTFRQCTLYRDDEALFRAAETVNPKSWMVESNLGSILLQKGRLADALPHLEEAAALGANVAETHYNLGVAYLSAGRNEEAASQEEASLRLQPTYPAAEGNLGAALSRLGRLQEAIGHFERALTGAPDDMVAQNGLGTALARLGRVPEAIPHFEAAVRLQPDSAASRANLANAYAITGQWSRAAEEFERALALDPSSQALRARLDYARDEAQK